MRRWFYILFLLYPIMAFAEVETIVVDGLCYNIVYYGSYLNGYSPKYAYLVSYETLPSSDIHIRNTIEAPLRQFDIEKDEAVLSMATFPVVGIDVFTFRNCQDIESVIIPKNIRSIGKFDESGDYDNLYVSQQNPFCGCNNLSQIVVDEENEYISSMNESNAIITSNGHKLIAGCKNTVIPTSVKIIGESAFEGCSELKSLDLPEGLKSIGDMAFWGCSGLTKIILPQELNKIGAYSFYGCNNITDVYCYSKPSLTKLQLYDESENSAFDESANNAILHVRDVDIELFKSDSAWAIFKEIVPIELVTDFNLTYFVDDEEYKSIKYKYNDSIIFEPYPTKDGYTFSGWHYVYYDEFNEVYIQTDSLILMPGKNVNAYGTFSVNKYKLTFLVDDVEYVSYSIDYGSATRVPENNPLKENYEFISWSEIPATMPARNITSTASFKKVSTDIDGVKYKYVGGEAYVIGNSTSGNVKVLSSFEEDGKTYTVTVIDKNAFRNNTNITSVDAPNTIVAINDSAFFGCRNLTNIDLGNSVSIVGERAFANIDKLTDVVCYREEVPDADRTSFENSYIDYVTLHVPAGSVERYKATGPWKDFKVIVAIEGTEPISVETCVMPTISFQDGKLEFESETDGAECHYEIKVEDAKEGVGSEVSLSSAYEISVYASKEGYNDSEKNSATLYWINVDSNSTGVIEKEMRVNTNAILVQNTGGAIVISGVADGENVLIYNISGQLIAHGKASGKYVEISTNLSIGDICIIKIGDKSVKYLLK